MDDKLHYTAPRDAFKFFASPDPEPVMTISPEGRFYIKGREVETDDEVRDTLAAWARLCLNQNGYDFRGRPTCRECGATSSAENPETKEDNDDTGKP